LKRHGIFSYDFIANFLEYDYESSASNLENCIIAVFRLTYSPSVAVTKKADRTAYNLRYRPIAEEPDRQQFRVYIEEP